MTLPRDSVADRRAVLRVRALRPTARGSRRAGRRRAIRIEARASTARASRCRTRWSRSGRPTARAGTDGDFGWARCGTDAEGRFAFTTVKPGRSRRAGAAHRRARLRARPAEAGADAHVLPGRRQGERERPVLVRASGSGRPRRSSRGRDDGALRFDVRLQGERQTSSSRFDAVRASSSFPTGSAAGVRPRMGRGDAGGGARARGGRGAGRRDPGRGGGGDRVGVRRRSRRRRRRSATGAERRATRRSRSCARCADAAATPAATSTAAPRARTSSTPRRCSSPVTRSRSFSSDVDGAADACARLADAHRATPMVAARTCFSRQCRRHSG